LFEGHFILQEDGSGCGCVDESPVLTARYAVVMFVFFKKNNGFSKNDWDQGVVLECVGYFYLKIY